MNLINESEEREWSFLAARIIFNQEFWTKSEKIPSYIGFQRFGVQLREEDFEQQGGTTYRGFLIRDRSVSRKDSSGFSHVRNENDRFCIDLDVWPFKCDELTAIVIPGLYLMIDGEHSKRCEDNSTCTRKFTRRYLLPKGCISRTMRASYSNFLLKIRADKNENEVEFKIPRTLDITRDDSDETITLGALKQCRRVPIANDVESPDKIEEDTLAKPGLCRKVPTATGDSESKDKMREDTLAALQKRREVPIVTEGSRYDDKTVEDASATLQKRREVPIVTEGSRNDDKTVEDASATLQKRREVSTATVDSESNDKTGENSTESSRENSTDEDSKSDKAGKNAGSDSLQ